MADRKMKPGKLPVKAPEPGEAQEDVKVTVGGSERDPSVASFNEQLLDDARKKGRDARTEGRQPEDCPFSEDYPGRGFKAAWVDGWYEAAREIAAAKAKLVPVVQVVPVTTPGMFWPKEKPLPTHYQKPDPLPCPKCRTIRLATQSQAVLVRSVQKTIVYLECRSCGHTFQMPIARIGALG